MSSKKSNNNLGLCPNKGEKFGLCSRTRARNQFSRLSLSTGKTSPPCQMLVIHPAFYLFFFILPRDPQGRLRSTQLLNRTVSCELVGDFVFLYLIMSRDPIQPHSVPGRGIIQCPFGTVIPMEKMFWLPEELSDPPGCQNQYFSCLTLI